MSEIVVGGYVRVPKGTPVFEGYGFDDPKPASRDQVVKVKSILPLHNVYVPRLNPIPGNDLRYIEWSGKMTLIGYVMPAEEPAKAKAPKKERAITKQQQMVKGSVWRLTEDVIFTYNENDQRWVDAHRAYHGKYGSTPNGSLDDLHKALNAKEIFEYIAKPYLKVLAGTEIKVSGKHNRGTMVSTKNGTVWMLYDGICVPFTTSGQNIMLPYSQLEPFVEAVDIPTTFQYVLRDRSTGLFMKTTPYCPWNGSEVKLEMTDKFMKAKRFDDMGRAKQSILGWTGYYVDMPGTDRPDWAGDSKAMDLPETWEAVKFDKLAKQEVETVDIQDWHKQTWKLRALTIQFGSPVRKLFKDIEKRGELDKYQGMVVVRAKIDANWRISYEDELSPEDIKSFEEIAESMGLTKGQYRRAKDDHCIAMAVATANDALFAKLAYSGDTPIAALDMQEMREIIEKEENK